MNSIPQAIRNILWSYDISKINIYTDKELIIFNVLNFGTTEAVVWLYKNYTEDEIKTVILNSFKNNWSKKSINYWSIIFNVSPQKLARF